MFNYLFRSDKYKCFNNKLSPVVYISYEFDKKDQKYKCIVLYFKTSRCHTSDH